MENGFLDDTRLSVSLKLDGLEGLSNYMSAFLTHVDFFRIRLAFDKVLFRFSSRALIGDFVIDF